MVTYVIIVSFVVMVSSFVDIVSFMIIVVFIVIVSLVEMAAFVSFLYGDMVLIIVSYECVRDAVDVVGLYH